jgi:hypothetical protein
MAYYQLYVCKKILKYKKGAPRMETPFSGIRG